MLFYFILSYKLVWTISGMNNITKVSGTMENTRQRLKKDEEGNMQRRERGRTRRQKASSIRLPGIKSPESAVEKRLRRLGINMTAQEDLPSIDFNRQSSTHSTDKDERNKDEQTVDSKLSTVSIVGTKSLCSQLEDPEGTKLSTDSSEENETSPAPPGKLNKDQPGSVELTDSEASSCNSPLVKDHRRSKEVHHSTSDFTQNYPELDANPDLDAKRGYFEIHLEEMFGDIIGIRRKTNTSVDGHRRPRQRQEVPQLYYSEAEGTVLELFSPRLRLSYVDLDRRRRQISKKSYADLVNVHNSAFHPVAAASDFTRAMSKLKEMSESSSLTTDNLSPSMNAGKIVRFLEPKGAHERLWDDRVQALEQLTSQKMAKIRRQSKANELARTNNKKHLTPLKGSKSTGELIQKKTEVEEDSYNESGDQCSFDSDHQGHDHCSVLAAMKASDKEQGQTRSGRYARQRGLIDYKNRKTEGKLANLVGFETLQDKVKSRLAFFSRAWVNLCKLFAEGFVELDTYVIKKSVWASVSTLQGSKVLLVIIISTVLLN